MTKYLLDTNICIFLLRKKLFPESIIGNKWYDQCFVSQITVLELRYGSENSYDPKKSHDELNRFLQIISIIPITGLEMPFAIEKVRLRKMGKPLHDELDLLIGITVVENNLTLVTDSIKDFSNIDGIKIENWLQKSS